jgi:hypothetical protein
MILKDERSRRGSLALSCQTPRGIRAGLDALKRAWFAVRGRICGHAVATARTREIRVRHLGALASGRARGSEASPRRCAAEIRSVRQSGPVQVVLIHTGSAPISGRWTLRCTRRFWLPKGSCLRKIPSRHQTEQPSGRLSVVGNEDGCESFLILNTILKLQ